MYSLASVECRPLFIINYINDRPEDFLHQLLLLFLPFAFVSVLSFSQKLKRIAQNKRDTKIAIG